MFLQSTRRFSTEWLSLKKRFMDEYLSKMLHAKTRCWSRVWYAHCPSSETQATPFKFTIILHISRNPWVSLLLFYSIISNLFFSNAGVIPSIFRGVGIWRTTLVTIYSERWVKKMAAGGTCSLMWGPDIRHTKLIAPLMRMMTGAPRRNIHVVSDRISKWRLTHSDWITKNMALSFDYDVLHYKSNTSERSTIQLITVSISPYRFIRLLGGKIAGQRPDLAIVRHHYFKIFWYRHRPS
jgi:hypothetical protein